MTELSPAAQAVINSAVKAGGGYGYATPVLHARLAAALRAAADQVVPEDYSECINDFALMDWDLAMEAKNHSIRDELLAIAAELEAQ